MRGDTFYEAGARSSRSLALHDEDELRSLALAVLAGELALRPRRRMAIEQKRISLLGVSFTRTKVLIEC